MARSFHPCHNHFRRKPLQIYLQNCEMKSNRAGLEDSPSGGNVRAADKGGEECANLNKVPKDTNSFLTDEVNLALSKFQIVLIKKTSFLFCRLQKVFEKPLRTKKLRSRISCFSFTDELLICAII